MTLASVLALIAAVVAVCVTILHGWIFALRRGDRMHLWLAVTGLGVAGMGIGTAMLYSHPIPFPADRLQGALFALAAPVLLGFFRYSFLYLELDRPHVSRLIDALCLSVLILGPWPGAMVNDADASQQLDRIIPAYARAELTGLGTGICLLLGAACIYMVVLYWRHLGRDDANRTTLIGMLTIWVATLVSDTVAALELHDGPFLIAFGYSAFMVGLSSVQIRRMASSMEAVARMATRLGELVDRRTSALRETEIQLAHGAQMATIGTLAANLAHEINNPIAYVSSNLNRVDEGWSEAHCPDEIDEILAECQEGIGRVRTIVQSLLALARRSDGVSQPVDLNALVDATLPVVRREAGLRARLETNLENVAPVDGDPRLLGHVVLSLVMHALNSIPSGEPEHNVIRIAAHTEDDRVVLSVSDTGPPLAPEEIERLLGGLLDEGPERDGRGLGLVVARQIIERHDGEMGIDSGAAGTTVSVRLPAL